MKILQYQIKLPEIQQKLAKMETVQENIVKFKFKIERFSKFYIEENREVCSKSVVNYNSRNQKSEWHLVFYPDGKDFVDEGYVSLFLELLDSDQSEMSVRYRLYIIDIFGDELNVKESEAVYTEPSGWGWSKFIRQEDLFENHCLLFPDGVLTLGCDFTILPKKQETIKQFPLLNIKSLETQKDDFDILNFEKSETETERQNLAVKKVGFGKSGLLLMTELITDKLKNIIVAFDDLFVF